MIRPLSIATICLALAACSGQLTRHYQQGDTGYRITLNTALTIAPDQARVFLQDGKVLPGHPDEYEPHCSFEVRYLSDEPQTIEADEFVISRVQQLVEEVVMLQPVQVAAVGLIKVSAEVDASPSDIFRGYHFWLRSESQPDVLRVTCRGILAAPWEAVPPTLAEMGQAMGTYATLNFSEKEIIPGRF